MLNKIVSLLVRGGVAFGISALVAGVFSVLKIGGDLYAVAIVSIWIAGGIYSLANFNKPYNFSAVENVENKVTEAIDNKNKQKIEEEMIRVKELFDNEILTEEEYNQKIKSLKEKYI